MRRLALVLLSSAISLWPASIAEQTFAPPEVASAGDAYTPYQIMVDGLFVLDVRLDGEGQIKNIEPLRNPGAMLDAAKTSVRTWKFLAASENGKPHASRLTVAFLYRPADYGRAATLPPKNFVPVIPRAESEHESEYIPAGILSFDYPEYPVNSVTWGSVVVQATIDIAGDVKDVSILHGANVFNHFAIDALKRWRFAPATLAGKPINSKSVIAFVFQTPPSGP